MALEGEEMEDFEYILNWVDNKFDLEVFQNSEWCSSDGWSIVDRSAEGARTVFIPEDIEEQEYGI